jgi:large subunit ribosomal protein L29
MKLKEIRELSQPEMVARVRELKDELFHLRVQKASGQLEKPSQLRSIRKEIAQIETVITQGKLAKAEKSAAAANK